MACKDEQDPASRKGAEIDLEEFRDRAYRLLDGLTEEPIPNEELPEPLKALDASGGDGYIVFQSGVRRELAIQEILKLDPNLEGPLKEIVLILPNQLSLFPVQRLAKQKLEDLGFWAAKFATDQGNVFSPTRLGMMAIGQILISESPPTPLFEDEQRGGLLKVYRVGSLDNFVSYLTDLWARREEIEAVSNDLLGHRRSHFKLASTEQTLSAYITGVALAFRYLDDRDRAHQVIEILPQESPLREALTSAFS